MCIGGSTWYDGADALRQELLTGGIVMPDARDDPADIIQHATEVIKRKRAQLQGKLRTRCILKAWFTWQVVKL